MTQNYFMISKHCPEINRLGSIVYVFNLRYQLDFAISQTIEVDCELLPIVPATKSLVGYALLLTTCVISKVRDGQRQFNSKKQSTVIKL